MTRLRDVLPGRYAFGLTGRGPRGGALAKGPYRLRVLAVSTAKRSPQMPELPTIAESGVPGYDVTPWYGILGPAHLPPAIVAKWNREVSRVVALPEMNERFVVQGVDLGASTSEAFASMIKAEVPRWRKIVRDSGARAD